MSNNPPSGKNVGAPQKNIDWKIVDDLLLAGCTGKEIAACIGIAADTLYHRCVEDKKVNFSHYSQLGYDKGDSLIKAAQMEVAIKKKDRSMLQFLGKVRLKQKETDTVAETQLQSEFKQFLDLHKTPSDTTVIEDISKENG
jgi:hypothetical protein